MSIRPIPWSVPMGPRDTGEPHRTSTPLELFFDLVFVVAIAAAASELHHGIAEGHLDAFVGFGMVFFAIWWAWMNYTWFASAYDSGDVVYRLLSFTIMTGSLIMAAGVPGMFEDGQSGLLVAGYCVMRLGMVALWLRAARGHPRGRRTALTYAAGIAAVQALWILRLLLHGEQVVIGSFVVLMALELAIPWLAERHQLTPYHPEHVAERYGLFTIIVLGEVVLASVLAVQGAIRREYAADLTPLIVGAVLVVYSLWWIYFKRDHADLFSSRSTTFAAGYGHLLVFASVAATGAAVAASVDVVTHHAHTTPGPVAWSLAAPVALYFASLGAIHALGDSTIAGSAAAWATAAAVLLVTAVGSALGVSMGTSVLLVGLVCAAAVAQHVVGQASWRVPQSAP